MKKTSQIFLTTALTFISTYTYSQNVQVFVRHEVKDYKVWKKGYDEYAMKQKEGGVYYQHVYQTIDNPNQVAVIHDFHSLEKAKAFFASEDLKSTMKKLVLLVSLKFGLCG
jgi:hypothetical protein